MTKSFLFFFAAVLLCFLYAGALLHFVVYMHEDAHLRVLESEGCQDAEIDYRYSEPGSELAVVEHSCFEASQHPAHDSIHERQEFVWVVYYLVCAAAVFLILELMRGLEQYFYKV